MIVETKKANSRTNKQKRNRAGSDRGQTKEKKYKNAKDTQTKNLLIVEYKKSKTGGQRQRSDKNTKNNNDNLLIVEYRKSKNGGQRQRSDNNGANEMIARFRLVLYHFDC